MATACFAALALVPLISVALIGNPADAGNTGSAVIEPLPLLEAASELDNNELTTPDLLAGDVPEGTNPTEEIKAKLDAIQLHLLPGMRLDQK